MPRTHRVRFWIELALASVTGLLALLTVVWPDWIEGVLGVDPDHGNGAAEWAVVVVCLALAVACSLAARLEWRRDLAEEYGSHAE
jgi:hypothetical protein